LPTLTVYVMLVVVVDVVVVSVRKRRRRRMNNRISVVCSGLVSIGNGRPRDSKKKEGELKRLDDNSNGNVDPF